MTIRRTLTLALWGALAVPAPGYAQDQRNEQFYYPGDFNWTFLKHFPEAGRLFNAFDYGHAVLYERLHRVLDSATAAQALEREYRFLTTDLLVRPPRFAVAEEAIAASYSKLAWRAKVTFDWAHILHRQIYDVLSDQRLTEAEKHAMVERLTDYYVSNRRAAFTDVPKSMALMDEQYYSQVFRRRYAKFNGLIWAYHWLQVGLYEPLLAGRTREEQQAGVRAALSKFWEMLSDAPDNMPLVMPMTPTVAPRFTELYPRAAAIFDNLHMMHDIISDILASEKVADKRAAIDAALNEFQDPTKNVETPEGWRAMGEMMGGVEAMGGAVPVAGPARAPTPQ